MVCGFEIDSNLTQFRFKMCVTKSFKFGTILLFSIVSLEKNCRNLQFEFYWKKSYIGF